MARLFPVVLLSFLLGACDIFNEAELAPGFIYIDSADVFTNLPLEGPPTHNITDVHVFANESFVGSYELPARIAVLENGPTRINVSAGIKNNGQISQRVIYPFYAPLLKEMDLIPGVVLPIREDSIAEFTYFQDAYEFYFEDFESIGNALESAEGSTAEIITQDQEVNFGQFSGQVTLTADAPLFEARTTWDTGGLPLGTPAYMEIDFKGNNPLEIGLVRQFGDAQQKIFVIGLREQEEWTKVYIDLRPRMAQAIGTSDFSFYFESQKPPQLSQVDLFIDNIKFVHLK